MNANECVKNYVYDLILLIFFEYSLLISVMKPNATEGEHMSMNSVIATVNSRCGDIKRLSHTNCVGQAL